MLAPLPAGIVGGFGPELRRFVLALHAQGQVMTERRTALLNGIGVEISKRQVVRLLTEPLDDLVAEDQEVLRAGLATARWVTVDDTAARHARKDGFTTQVGDTSEIACDLRGFAVFRTGASKSREAFLSVLRAGHTDYGVNAAALDFTRRCLKCRAGPGHILIVNQEGRGWWDLLSGPRATCSTCCATLTPVSDSAGPATCYTRRPTL